MVSWGLAPLDRRPSPVSVFVGTRPLGLGAVPVQNLPGPLNSGVTVVKPEGFSLALCVSHFLRAERLAWSPPPTGSTSRSSTVCSAFCATCTAPAPPMLDRCQHPDHKGPRPESLLNRQDPPESLLNTRPSPASAPPGFDLPLYLILGKERELGLVRATSIPHGVKQPMFAHALLIPRAHAPRNLPQHATWKVSKDGQPNSGISLFPPFRRVLR